MKLREKAVEHNNIFKGIISPNSEDSTEEKYNKLSELIKFITDVTDPFASNPESYNDVIFLMGPTGAGKSTLTNYLAGKKLYYQLHNNMPGIFPAEGESVAFVGQGAGSTTLAPNMWRDDTGIFGGAVFIDCAGECDTGGVVIDVINEKIKSTIAQNINRAKILLVTSQDSIGPAGSYGLSFKQGLEKSAQFLNDITHFQNSMGFVVTHAGRNRATENTVKSYLEHVIANQALDKYKDVLQDVTNKGLVETFSKYSDEDDVGYEYVPPNWNQNQRDALIELITKIDFQEVPKDFFNLSSSAEMREQMSIAFKILEKKATDLLKNSFEAAVSDKIVIQCLRLKSFLEFFDSESGIQEQSKGLNLSQYIKLINDHNFIKLVTPEGIDKLSSEMDFFWPYTQNLDQQHSQPCIDWNSYISYQALLGELIQEARGLLFGTEDVVQVFHEGNRIITKGCFALSPELKGKFGVLANACQSKHNVENSKAGYYYNVTEKQFVGMKQEADGNEPYVDGKESYTEKVEVTVDVEVPYKDYQYVDVLGFFNRSHTWPNTNLHRDATGVKKSGYKLCGSREITRESADPSFPPHYVKQDIYEKYLIRTEKQVKVIDVRKEKDVIKYRPKYKDVPEYKDVTKLKFNETKYNADINNVSKDMDAAANDIVTCISQLKAINAQIKASLPSDKAFAAEEKAKAESDLYEIKNTPLHVSQDFENLQEEWKYLEHEAKVLGEICYEMGIEVDFSI